jgi:putative exosortase-associated protein (TIGR04073 family)
MKRLFAATLLWSLSLCVSAEAARAADTEPAPAADAAGPQCQICKHASDQQAGYAETAGLTLARGAANTALGWTELIRQPADEVKRGGNVVVGIGKGVGQGVVRTLSGIGEVLTFWTPKVHDRYVRFATDCPICMGRR